MLSPGNFIFKSASNNRAESEPYEKILVERRVNALRKACSYRNVEIAPDLEYAMHHYAQSFRLCGNEISAAGESSFKGINEISACNPLRCLTTSPIQKTKSIRKLQPY